MNRRNFQQGFNGQQMKGKNNFAIIFLAFAFSILTGLTQAQTLGVYAFTGSNGCNSVEVTTQPSNATFGSYSSVNTNCENTSNIFERDAWNTATTINTSEYNQFSITPASGYVLNLTNITFTQEMSYNNSTTWALRSSVDNYTSNIATGTATTTSQTPSITLSGFTNLGATTFRLYIINANSSATNWSNDNVTLSGTVTLACTAPTAPGNPTSNSPQCATSGVTLTKSGSAPSGVTWYWQGTNSAGTNTANNATSTYNATTTGTYYIRAKNDADACWSESSGSIAVTVNQLPTITLGSNPSVCIGTTTANLTYSATTDSPDKYSIDYDATAESAGFTDVVNATLPSSPITLTVPSGATAGTYNYTVSVKNNTTTCTSAGTAKTITIAAPSTVTPGGPDIALQSASPSSITLSGASVGGSATTGAWSITSGGGSLSSTSQTSSPQTVTYTPAANYSGQVILTLTTNSGTCSSVNGTRTITVNPVTVQTFTTTSTWTAPFSVSQITVEAWGAGGGAGGSNASNGGSGGGGGAFSSITMSVTPQTTYSLQVGAGGSGGSPNTAGSAGGDSWFDNASTVLAKGGSGGGASGGAVGAGGNSGAGIGTTVYSGGNGGLGNGSGGGGGGSSAGTTANGNNGNNMSSGGAGGAAPTGGGAGANGNTTTNGHSATALGGGGAGGDDESDVSGGAGFRGQITLRWAASLSIGNNSVAEADVCGNTSNVPLHSFSLQGDNSSVTDVNFVTTGNYASTEITNFKLYYTNTNTFSTTNLLSTITSPTIAGTQTFPAFSLAVGAGNNKYLWITMDVASTVTNGHTIAVNGTSPSNITASVTATGSGSASGIHTLKPNASISLTSATGTNNQSVCINTAITNITYSVTDGGTGASVTGLPGGVAGAYNSGLVTISGTPSVTGTYNYSVNTTGTCTQTSATGTITVNALPTVGSTITPSSTVSAGTSVTLNGTGASTYTWTGGVADGVAFVPTSTTTYTVTGTDTNGCLNTSTRTITVLVGPEGTWTGLSSTDWFTASNWVGSVPTDTTDVVIPSNAPNMPTISSADGAECKSITIDSAAVLITSNSKNLDVYGNWTNNGTYTSNNGNITFKGTIQQTTFGHATTFSNLIINKSGLLSLNAPLIISDSLSLMKGIVETSNAVLQFLDNTTTSSGSDSSYVSGPVKKIGNDIFTFPLGDTSLTTGAYHPLSITAPSNSTDVFTAQYVAQRQFVSATPIMEMDSLESISDCEYWLLYREVGTSIVIPSLGWNSNSCNVGENEDLRLAGWNGTLWTSMGNASFTVNGSKGTIVGTNGINTNLLPIVLGRFGSFTLNTVGMDTLPSPYDTLKYRIYGASGIEGIYNSGTVVKFNHAQIADTGNTITVSFYGFPVPDSATSDSIKILFDINKFRRVSNLRAVHQDTISAMDSVYFFVDQRILALLNGTKRYQDQLPAPLDILLEGGITMSPNNDSSFDNFVVVSNVPLSSYHLQILDINSSLIFETSSLSQHWDGTNSGNDLVPVGNYFYHIDFDGHSVGGQFLVEY